MPTLLNNYKRLSKEFDELKVDFDRLKSETDKAKAEAAAREEARGKEEADRINAAVDERLKAEKKKKSKQNANHAPQKSGLMSDLAHAQAYEKEVLAIRALLEELTLLFKLLINEPYLRQLVQYRVACLQEREAYLSGQENYRLIYQKDKNGTYPFVYPIVDGEPDKDAEPLPENQVTEALAKANGYMIPPKTGWKGFLSDFGKGYITALDEHIENVLGVGMQDDNVPDFKRIRPTPR